ncbi:hypothetical protein BH24ACT3_BH24ACT3_07580 [soil metagenome]
MTRRTHAAGVSAVTFDYWNTLVREDAGKRDHRLDAWLGLLEGEGMAVERERLGAAFAANWRAFDERWKANRPFGAADAAEFILGELGYSVPPELNDALVATFTEPGERRPELTPNVAATLRRLQGAGVRIGIICDVGLTPSPVLRRFLADHSVLDAFDHWSFSDEVGCYKPSPDIFDHALAGLGVDDPATAAHVGDLRRTDVAGARAAGMVAVRYRGIFDDPGPEDDPAPPEGHHVVTDHAELPEVLGIG